MNKENHLIFRAPEPTDIDFMYEQENQTDIWRVGHTIVPFSKEFLTRYVFSCMEDELNVSKQARFIIEDRCLNQNIGILDLFNYDPIHRRAEIGILIVKEHQNQHYGSKILEKFFIYAWEILNLHQIYAEIASNNLSAYQLFCKTGFQTCALKREWFYEKGEWIDLIGFQKLSIEK
ncbi:MAG: GNAT family protein [Bacteroidales bacterium]